MRSGKAGLWLLAFWSFMAVRALGQAAPSAIYRVPHLQAGAEFSGFNTDVAKSPPPFEYGVGVFADLQLLGPLGIEGEARTIQFNRQDNVRQDVVSGGVRYVFQRGFFANRRFAPYAKALAGLGSADFPAGTMGSAPTQQHDTMPVFTVGGGVDYALGQRVSLRGEYEYQFWTSYGRGVLEQGFGSTNPNGFSVGVAYRFF